MSKKKIALITFYILALLAIIYSMNLNMDFIDSQRKITMNVYEKTIPKLIKDVDLSDIENVAEKKVYNISSVTPIVDNMLVLLPFGDEEIKNRVHEYDKYTMVLSRVWILKSDKEEIPSDVYEKLLELNELYKKGD